MFLSLSLLSLFGRLVTCVIMQRTGAGFYAGSSVYWDNNNDGKVSSPFLCLVESIGTHFNIITTHLKGSASYRYESKSVYAVINAFGLSV